MPVTRLLDDGLALEVTRLATIGTRHAASKLYATVWRAGRATDRVARPRWHAPC